MTPLSAQSGVDEQMAVMKVRLSITEWIVCGVVVAILFALVAPGIEVGAERQYTCALCRANRIDATRLWRQSSRIEESACSVWYATNVRKDHDHLWISSASETGYNIFGRAIRARSGERNSLWFITPQEQVRIYDHFPDKAAAVDLFSRIADSESAGSQVERTAMLREAERTVRQLQAWEKAGFPGTWEEWTRTGAN